LIAARKLHTEIKMAKAKTMKNVDADELVLKLLAEVRQRKQEIEKLNKPVWKTNCTIGFSDGIADRVNIHTVYEASKIVEIYAKLLAKEQQWERANQELGLDAPKIHQASSFADWKDDLKTRAAQIGLEQKRKELRNLEQRLDGLITVEQRRELELAAIAAELGK
jgi:hypothetical protein